MTHFTENIVLDGALVSKLRADLVDLFEVDRVEIPRQMASELAWPFNRLRRKSPENIPERSGVFFFVGQLLRPNSEEVYNQIAERWRAHDYTPMLRYYQTQIALIAQPGVVNPKPANPWINLALGLATVLSILFTGAVYESQNLPVTLADWLSGMPMMLTMVLILLAHEFGHYFAARYHKVGVTLPYFIPLPLVSPVGTLGAFIQLRSPFKTKKELFDIGVAGPLAGLIFAVPLIFWGVSGSKITGIMHGENSVMEGNSIFYLAVKYILHGQLLPSFDQYANMPFGREFMLLLAGIIPPGGGTDIFIGSMAFAAWFGLFVTAMNLLPVGQLDGGHVMYSLLGPKARQLGLIMIGIMVLAGIFWWTGWLVWAMLTFFIVGPGHPPPLNDLVELGPGRKALAYLTIILFFILFMPNPLQPM
jgi:membrane-associated protease RseP (regulator of RpoE activity)